MSSRHMLNLKLGSGATLQCIGPMSTGKALFSLINVNNKLINHKFSEIRIIEMKKIRLLAVGGKKGWWEEK